VGDVDTRRLMAANQSRARRAGCALAGIGVLILAGCGGAGSGKFIPRASPTPSPASSKPVSRHVVVATQPLTGLPVTNVEQSRRPAFYVKVENSPEARPQTGLDKADVVYEALAEGGITRFAAVFQGTDPFVVGPVRSVRPQDADLAAPLHGLAAFSGGVGPIVSDVSTVAQTFDDDAGSPVFYRSTDRYAPHNLYLNTDKAWVAAAAPYNRAPQKQFTFGSLPGGSRAAAAVDVPMSYVADIRWTWSAGAWHRSQNGVPFTAAGTGSIAPANVLLEYVKIANAGYTDVAGTSVPDSVVVGSGRAQLFRDGKVIEGTWSKLARADITTFTTTGGKPLALHPGRTWIELVPDSVTATVTP
jgi:Protein of unknown function (DUF3048) N-terminal domain/Protein of unknown function (DUF3048) C-terminal domain